MLREGRDQLMLDYCGTETFMSMSTFFARKSNKYIVFSLFLCFFFFQNNVSVYRFAFQLNAFVFFLEKKVSFF